MSAAEKDMSVLFPDSTLTLAGREVIVREFTYKEALNLSVTAYPLLSTMAEAASEGAGYLLFDKVIPPHWDLWLKLLSIATGEDPAWIEGLNNRDGELLTLTFWRVNSDFFTRRISLMRPASSAEIAQEPEASA